MVRRLPVVWVVLALLLIVMTLGRSPAADVPVTRVGHMEMTLRGPSNPGDAARGAAILAAARAVMAKYAKVADAERDGYVKFLPKIPLPYEHYTKRENAVTAEIGAFDPSLPTSLIYHRTAAGLAIAGVMYTAPNRFDEAQLDGRVPISLGTWHRHIDFCWAPVGTYGDPRFGFSGSIVTKDACEAAGGRFTPRIFGWMVHVWPNETAFAKIWAVDADGEMAHGSNETVYDQATLPIAREKLPTMAVTSGDVARGAAIFSGNCASCHGAGGANGPDAPRLRASGLSAGQVAYMVHDPHAIDPSSSMPELGLSDRDVADVAAYVASLSAPAGR